MNAARPPGWHADPDGVPGRLRWWDGTAWGDVTLTSPSPPEDAPGDEPADRTGPAARRRRPTGRPSLVASVAALVAAAALAAAVLPRPARDGGDRAGATFHPAVEAPPVGPPELPLPVPDPTYVGGRVVDPAAGLSYARPAGAWREWDPGDMLLFGLGSAGVYQVTQRTLPDGGDDRAEIVSGPLLPVVAYTGPPDLPEAAVELGESLERVYFPRHSRRTLASRTVSVDGHPGYLVRTDLAFDATVRGYDATGSALAVVVVDTGRPTPGVLYIAIPDTRRALWPQIDRTISSLHVIG